MVGDGSLVVGRWQVGGGWMVGRSYIVGSYVLSRALLIHVRWSFVWLVLYSNLVPYSCHEK